MTLEELADDYDWGEAFEYAAKPNRCEGASWSCREGAFGVGDVVEIRAAVAGENDGEPWRMVGRLRDGRWFYLEAWCDYTGWDCQAGGFAVVSDDYENLLQFGVTDPAAGAFGF